MILGVRRWHLMEIHEQPWCPPAIRDGATDYLRFIATVAQQYRYVVPLLQEALHESGSRRIVDLCSGSGGPWLQLQPMLNATSPAVPILLTDLYPSQAPPSVSSSPNLHFLTTAVDATHIPAELTGLRTLFTAFHHFPPPRARALLQDAVDAEQGIGIFEQTARTPLALLVMLLLPWLSLLVAPFVRPWRWKRLFWTLVIPLIPLVLCCDGVVSCLRTYSTTELQEMVNTLQPPPSGLHYKWQIGHLPSPLSPIGVTYAIGYPVRAETNGPRVAPTR
ncbi:MAG: hypothetical protein R3C14_47925 [Caldilineaceae bacterium]